MLFGNVEIFVSIFCLSGLIGYIVGIDLILFVIFIV